MSTVIDHINLDLNNDGKTKRYDLASGASVHMEDGSTVVINNGNATSYDVHVSNFEYSEEERVVGCWTDGKPVYERIVSITIDVPNQNTILYFTGDYIADNIEYITIIRSFTNNSVSYGSSGYINSTNKRTQFYIDNGYIRACSDRTVDTGIWRIVVQYTKSTDLPNSFKPSMLNIKSIVPQHNYSTEEKIVGTWIDGKPLYEKSYYIPNPINADQWSYENIEDVSDKTIVNISGSVTRAIPEGNIVYPLNTYEQDNYLSLVRVSAGMLTYRTRFVNNEVKDLNITIRYIKN